ncbi:MAG: baseplate J/gp47 family protein [Acidimicrobiia bacterium]|nr:baseplate J/gp47 family protein [Acidimicrobiia bacterium]
MPTHDVPAIDYTDKDFRSLRRALLDLAEYRLPEWTDRSAGDLGMLFVDLFAYVGDIVSYYQDRLASEQYLDTATERRSVMHLLRLIGYELTPAAAAACEVQLDFDKPADNQPSTTRIRRGFSVESEPDPVSGAGPVAFTYLGPDRVVDLAGADVTPQPPNLVRLTAMLPMTQGVLRPPTVIGSSRGEAGLRLRLATEPVVLDTVVVEVFEGGAWTPWPRRRNLFVDIGDAGVEVATSVDLGHTLEVDAAGVTWVVFGDGEFYKRPPAGTDNVRASYVAGGGTYGNIGPGRVLRPKEETPAKLKAATNPRRASGGAEPEPIDRAVQHAPRAFRSGNRAVTLRDYETIARQVPGVAKVKAKTVSWNRVDLYVAMEGRAWRALQAHQRLAVQTHFDDRRMIGTSLRVRDATPVPIDIALDVYAEPHHDAAGVRQLAEEAVRRLVAYETTEFGRPLYLSKVYEAVEAIAGVRAATVTRFRRRPTPVPRQLRVDRRRLVSLDRLDLSGFDLGVGVDHRDAAEVVRRTVRSEIPWDGRLEVDTFELPVAGDVEAILRYER